MFKKGEGARPIQPEVVDFIVRHWMEAPISKKEYCKLFGISIPTMNKYLKGKENEFEL